MAFLHTPLLGVPQKPNHEVAHSRVNVATVIHHFISCITINSAICQLVVQKVADCYAEHAHTFFGNICAVICVYYQLMWIFPHKNDISGIWEGTYIWAAVDNILKNWLSTCKAVHEHNLSLWCENWGKEFWAVLLWHSWDSLMSDTAW